jgi:steroid 5-alpha reductase family enzyme
LCKSGKIVRKNGALNISKTIFGMLFVFVILLFFVTIPTGNSEIVYMTFGTFIGIVGTVAAFYFGSSSGSKEKSDGIMRVLGKMN